MFFRSVAAKGSYQSSVCSYQLIQDVHYSFFIVDDTVMPVNIGNCYVFSQNYQLMAGDWQLRA